MASDFSRVTTLHASSQWDAEWRNGSLYLKGGL